MKGLGIDDDCLIRVVVSRSEVDLAEIKDKFLLQHHKPLSKMIEEDTSGTSDPQVALILPCLCGRYCKLIHLARATPPSLVSEALQLFDIEVISVDSITASPFHQRVLSKKLEGHQFSILLEAHHLPTRLDSSLCQLLMLYLGCWLHHLLVLICTLTLTRCQWWLGMDKDIEDPYALYALSQLLTSLATMLPPANGGSKHVLGNIVFSLSLVIMLTQTTPVEATFTQTPGNTSALLGTTAQFNCTADGVAGVTYLVNSMTVINVASIGVTQSIVYSGSQIIAYLYVPVTKDTNNYSVVCVACLLDVTCVYSPPAYLKVETMVYEHKISFGLQCLASNFGTIVNDITNLIVMLC
eukprot:Em0012g50a